MDPMRLACFFIGTGYILDTCMGCINASEIIIDDFLLSCNCSCGCFAYAFVSEMIMIPYKIFLLSYCSLDSRRATCAAQTCPYPKIVGLGFRVI